MKFDLPKADEWNFAENYAENLRSATVAGEKVCVPVGTPRTVQSEAGLLTTVLPGDGGGVLSVSDDYHDVMFNGQPAGSLGAPLLSVLPLGTSGDAVLFTPAGPTWFSQGRVQGAAPEGASVRLTESAERLTLSSQVLPPALTGNYSRLSGPLTAEDAAAFADAVKGCLQSIRAQAESCSRWVQPAWVSWRMVDADGRTVCSGTPQRVGSIQGSNVLTFKTRLSDSGNAVIDNSATVSVRAYMLSVSIGKCDSTFWRSRVKALEILAWPELAEITGVTGAFTHTSSTEGTLTLLPNIREMQREEVGTQIVARIEHPLDGVDCQLPLMKLNDATLAEESEQIAAAAVYSGGTLTAYALAGETGIIAVAASDDPLMARVRKKVCQGRIISICAPIGGGGGWNYGRHHLLVFSTDGIYSVSVDSNMKNVSSAMIHAIGVNRPDAVAGASDCVYVANSAGALMRLRGSKMSPAECPLRVAAVCWNGARSELWGATAQGAAAVIDSAGRFSLRSDIAVSRFPAPAMAVDTTGALCDLADELPVNIHIGWRRRTVNDRPAAHKPLRMAQWRIDTERATDLRLKLTADSGGEPQRLLELTVNGPINAPIRTTMLAPYRPYLTASLEGTVRPPARIHSLSFSFDTVKFVG